MKSSGPWRERRIGATKAQRRTDGAWRKRESTCARRKMNRRLAASVDGTEGDCVNVVWQWLRDVVDWRASKLVVGGLRSDGGS
jgi:hypothetical protein